MERIKNEVRQLDMQSSNLAQAETTLGQTMDSLQRFRELAISAANASLDTGQRSGIAAEMQSLRNSMLALANRQDSNGLPLFGGLGSIDVPFVETAQGVEFRGLPGQVSQGEVSLPMVFDGQRTWMFSTLRDGVYSASFETRTGDWQPSAPVVRDLSQLQDTTYRLVFNAGQFEVFDADNNSVTNGPFVDGSPIEFDGLSVTVRGTPNDGDALNIEPVKSIFSALDIAIEGLQAGDQAEVMQTVSQLLASLDAGMNQIQATRGQIGAMMNLADRINAQQTDRTLELEKLRSSLQDLDMFEGLSQLEQLQTGYDVALKSYAQWQRLSLFDYIR
jgi:flagellar hook-associated protein 3 FlgL